MIEPFLITEKINEVRNEMKRNGLWKNESPAWVKVFDKRTSISGEYFCYWLQFVYLPNRMQDAENRQMIIEKSYIVPQVMKFFGSDIKKGKLLQLLIELDALS